MRHPITQFTYFGVSYDYTNARYEIDDDLCVYTNGRMLRRRLMRVGLYHHGIETAFSVARLWLAVTKPLPVEIEAASGIRVIDHLLPETDARRYGYETPSDREELRRAQQARLDALVTDVWKTVQYNGDILDKYEISMKTAAIRNARTKILLRSNKKRITLKVDGGTLRVVSPYRAYMWTFESKSRLPHQDQVDHINGDHMDNSPCNLRWASKSENLAYIFKTQVPMKKGVPYTGDLRDLKRFRDSNYYFGVVDGDYAVIDLHKRMRRVGEFRTTSRMPYPGVTIRDRWYMIHRVVALVEGIISPEQFDNPSKEALVMHLDDNKTNFRPENLRLGTSSENSICTHENPLTTRKKRVRQLDDDGKCITEFESLGAAAEAVRSHRQNIKLAITRKRHCKGYRWELVDQAFFKSSLLCHVD
jgi:hypothetical protein